MLHRRAAMITAVMLALTACTTGETSRNASAPTPGTEALPRTDTAATNTNGVDPESPATSPSGPATTSLDRPDSTDGADTTSSTPTTPTSTTTTSTPTTVVPELDVFDPTCVVEVESGDSLGVIVERYDDPTITTATVSAENTIEADTIYPGQFLDICVDNGLDDITGAERERNAAIVADEVAVAVRAQQTKLNELFAGYGIRDLLVDGVSGSVTRQRLCAARLGLGLEITLTNMEPGSDEEIALFAAENIAAPFTTALNSERWILIDRTCQIMFVGEGPTQLNNVFPTSTGSEGFETRDQDRSSVFRYDPAVQNNGWHNSKTFPVAIDNPLNGNMYRPLYFDGGQAIHGANNVPTTPQSKGCARLRPGDQDVLVEWLGLADASGPGGRVGVTVNVQGEYQHSPTG